MITPPRTFFDQSSSSDIGHSRVSNAQSGNSVFEDKSPGHLYWLDLIRFIAAFAVLSCHFRGAFFVDYTSLPESQQNPIVFAFYSITRLGFEAVLIFFVLSGFLVGGKTIIRLRHKAFNARKYIVDRFVRIMLPLISSLLFYLPIVLYYGLPFDLKDWIGSLLSVQGILTGCAFETLWSLSYEVWFYILIGSIAVVLTSANAAPGNKYIDRVGIIGLILCMCVFCKLNVVYLFSWFLGAFAYLSISRKSNLVLVSSGIASLVFIVVLQISSGSKLFSFETGNTMFYRNVIIILSSFVLSVFIKNIVLYKPMCKFTVGLNLLGTKLAAFSYTLYLTHVPTMRLLQSWGVPKSERIDIASIAWYLVELFFAMFVAYMLYLLFEKHTPEVKRWMCKLLIH